PGERRSLQRRELDPRRCRRLSEHHGARWRGLWSAGRPLLHRQGLVGAEADRARVLLRAGDQASSSASVQSQRAVATEATEATENTDECLCCPCGLWPAWSVACVVCGLSVAVSD